MSGSPQSASHRRGRGASLGSQVVGAQRPGHNLGAFAQLAAVVTGSTLISDRRWSYDWAEIVWIDATTYRTVAGGRSSTTHGQAYNDLEAGNTAGNVYQTIGVKPDASHALDVQPIGVGGVEVPVLIRLVPAGADGALVARFACPNGFEGECEVVTQAPSMGESVTALLSDAVILDEDGNPEIDEDGNVALDESASAAEAALYDAIEVDEDFAIVLDDAFNPTADDDAHENFADLLDRLDAGEGASLIHDEDLNLIEQE